MFIAVHLQNLLLVCQQHYSLTNLHNLTEQQSTTNRLLFLTIVVGAFTIRKFRKRIKKHMLKSSNNTPNQYYYDEDEALAILLIALVIAGIYYLIKFLVGTFSIWIPWLLGIFGLALVIFLVWFFFFSPKAQRRQDIRRKVNNEKQKAKEKQEKDLKKNDDPFNN